MFISSQTELSLPLIGVLDLVIIVVSIASSVVEGGIVIAELFKPVCFVEIVVLTGASVVALTLVSFEPSLDMEDVASFVVTIYQLKLLC